MNKKEVNTMVFATISQQVWQDEMIEGLIEGQGEEEREGEEESDLVRPNKRPVLAGNRKTLQQRRREQDRKMKV